MINIENINDVILALDKIDSCRREINVIEQEIQDLLLQKEKEKKKYEEIVFADRDVFVKEILKKADLDSLFPYEWDVKYPPYYWENPKKDHGILLPTSKLSIEILKREREKAQEEKRWKKEIEKTFLDEMKEKRYNAFRRYEEAFLAVVKECENKHDEALACRNSNDKKIEKEFAIKEKELADKKAQLEQQLNSITLIPQELFADAAKISTLLKQKRADSLKEAINLALDEKRKDQEELNRQKEAAEQQRLLENQNWQISYQTHRMERAAEEKARENASMMSAAKKRCFKCAHRYDCDLKDTKGAIGCASYRPES